MISLGVGLVYRNLSDYEQQDTLVRSNISEFEVRYRGLVGELQKFIIQNDRITDILQKANDTFVTDTTYQLSNRCICRRIFIAFVFFLQLESIKSCKRSILSVEQVIVNINLQSIKHSSCKEESIHIEKH